MIDGLLVHNAITVEERESWEPILSSTYARVLDLHRRNWNGIWFRIVRNYFWSSTAGEFDVIVGKSPVGPLVKVTRTVSERECSYMP